MRKRFGSGWKWRVMCLLAFVSFLGAQGIVSAQEDAQSVSGGPFAGAHMVRGTVTAVEADHLTVKTEEGETYQVVVSDNTRIMENRAPVKLTDVKTGDGIGAMGVMDAPTKTLHAVFVGVVDAEQVKKAREDLGKTFITGTVTAIDMDNARLTVKRPDGVSQTIQADETTSFKQGRRRERSGAGQANPGAGANTDPAAESITLADIKAGDLVGGRGSIKNGMFVPTELRVMHPRPREGRRRGNMPPVAGSGMQNSK